MSDAIKQFSDWRQLKVKDSAVKGYELILRQFCLFLRNPNIEDVKVFDIINFFGIMRDLGWKQNSFIPKAIALRKFFEFYRLQGFKVISEELIPIPSKEHTLPRVLDDKTYQKLLAVIPEGSNDPRHVRNKAFLLFLHDTGARLGEILSLDVPDLDFERKRAVINTEKNKGSRPFREIFWEKDANDALKDWVKKRSTLRLKKDSLALFTGYTGRRPGERLTQKGADELLRRYSHMAGLERTVNAHSFRHKFCHDVIKKGGSSADVMNLAGHATIASSSVYTMMFDKELEARYRKLRG